MTALTELQEVAKKHKLNFDKAINHLRQKDKNLADSVSNTTEQFGKYKSLPEFIQNPVTFSFYASKGLIEDLKGMRADNNYRETLQMIESLDENYRHSNLYGPNFDKATEQLTRHYTPDRNLGSQDSEYFQAIDYLGTLFPNVEEYKNNKLAKEGNTLNSGTSKNLADMSSQKNRLKDLAFGTPSEELTNSFVKAEEEKDMEKNWGRERDLTDTTKHNPTDDGSHITVPRGRFNLLLEREEQLNKLQEQQSKQKDTQESIYQTSMKLHDELDEMTKELESTKKLNSNLEEQIDLLKTTTDKTVNVTQEDPTLTAKLEQANQITETLNYNNKVLEESNRALNQQNDILRKDNQTMKADLEFVENWEKLRIEELEESLLAEEETNKKNLAMIEKQKKQLASLHKANQQFKKANDLLEYEVENEYDTSAWRHLGRGVKKGFRSLFGYDRYEDDDDEVEVTKTNKKQQ